MALEPATARLRSPCSSGWATRRVGKLFVEVAIAKNYHRNKPRIVPMQGGNIDGMDPVNPEEP